MIVIDDLDKRLDFAASLLPLFRHAAGHLCRIAFDASDESVRESMSLGACIKCVYYDDLEYTISALEG